MQKIVRRAYELGRSDALKKVVDVLNADSDCSERLALMAPETTEQAPPPTPPPEHQKAANDWQPSMSSEPAPWWAWKVR